MVFRIIVFTCCLFLGLDSWGRGMEEAPPSPKGVKLGWEAMRQRGKEAKRTTPAFSHPSMRGILRPHPNPSPKEKGQEEWRCHECSNACFFALPQVLLSPSCKEVETSPLPFYQGEGQENTQFVNRQSSFSMGDDSIAIMKAFVAVCTGYKKLPVQVVMQIVSYTNWMESPEDSSSVTVICQMQKGGSYVQYGPFEQLIEDSMVLLLNNQEQRILYSKPSPQQLEMSNTMLGFALPDSSIMKLFKKFTIAISGDKSNKQQEINLSSRARLVSTQQPKQTVLLHFQRDTNEIIDVAQVERSLVLIDSSNYEVMVNNPLYKNQLLKIEGEYYIIKEQETVFKYTSLKHEEGKALPVHISNWITKNEQGFWQPVKGYEGFRLVKM